MRFVLGLLLLGFLQPLSALDIYLNRVARLKEAEYFLGEVATVVSADTNSRRQLENLRLGMTPEHLTLLPLRHIKERVEARLPDRIFFIGDRIGLIPENAVSEEEEWFYEQLLRDLDAQLVRKEGRVEIELLSRPKVDQLAASGPVLFELTGSRAVQDYPAGSIRVRYRPQTAPEQEGTFQVLLHHYLPVAKAGRDLSSGTLLTRADLEYQELDLADRPGNYLTAVDLQEAYRLHLTVRRGSLIHRSQVSRVMAVQAGDEVRLNFLSQGIVVNLQGKAFDSGGIGELVEVRIPGSPRRFSGKITAPKEVTIELP